MRINEIFSSIDGEARRAGELATFIRTVGCNLRCSFCDSQYTWGTESTNREMTVDELIDECKKLGNHNITFTGGEPLLQKDADELIIRLHQEGFDISIETDGAVDFTTRKWFQMYDEAGKYQPYPNVWVCADYKCPSSGMTDRMLPLSKFAQLRPNDVLKMVVGSEEDLKEALRVISVMRDTYQCRCWIYLSPVFGNIEPREIVEFMQKHNLQDRIKFQLQIHKIVWDAKKRGV